MEKQNIKIILALLGGAAAGATMAMLFAPSKGSELRNKIDGEFAGLTGNLDKKIHDFSNMIKRANDIYHELKIK